LFSGTALADGVVVPRKGGGTVLDGATLSEVGSFSLPSESVPLLAVHPVAPIMASSTPEQGLVFWNLPSFKEASRHEDPLLKDGIVDLAFSHDGESLYLLSEELRAVIVFDLKSSKVKSVIAVAGGSPQGLEVAEAGLLVRQQGGVSLLSPSPETGLLIQFRYEEKVQAAQVVGSHIYLGLQGQTGLWVYRLPEGRTVGLLSTEAEATQVSAKGTGDGLVVLTSSGGLEARSLSQGGPGWTFAGGGSYRFDSFASAPHGRVLYAQDVDTGGLVAVDSQSGSELARASLPGSSGPVVVFLGQAR